MSSAPDTFADGLFDSQLDVAKRAIAEVNRLRAENRALRAAIAAFPSEVTAAQDMIVLLQLRIAELTVAWEQAQEAGRG